MPQDAIHTTKTKAFLMEVVLSLGLKPSKPCKDSTKKEDRKIIDTGILPFSPIDARI